MGRKRKSQLTGSAGVFFKRIVCKKRIIEAEVCEEESKEKTQLWKKTDDWRPIL